ncbi:hypothetical protein CLIB1423_01S06018 [[Candida] railenensis]|uniref:Uncharacterized protein n=1 Tax=[Candida] railenensis TaxID=45579 RepID=A0A9P0QKS3_9ASCO|nr:hypothetical protein CLIB1423_01S06018 [[Candida] railenensis]
MLYRGFSNKLIRIRDLKYSAKLYSSSSPRNSLSPILDELQDRTKLAPQREKLHERDILVINPYRLEDAKLKRLHDQHAISPNHSSQTGISNWNLLQDHSQNTGPDINGDANLGLFQSIESINLQTSLKDEISKGEYMAMTNKLCKSFSRKQLFKYVQIRCSSSTGISKKTKKQLSEFIVTSIWNLKVSESNIDFTDLRKKKTLEFPIQDMHLLLSNNGEIIKSLLKINVQVSILPDGKGITLTGGPDQIQAAELIINIRIQRAFKGTFDLKVIKSLFEEKFGKFDLDVVSKTTEVFFKELEASSDHPGVSNGGIYQFIALTNEQVRRANRLLLWLLDYNTHRSEKLLVIGSKNEAEKEDLHFFPYRDQDSLSWLSREKNLVRLKKDTDEIYVNENIAKELERYSDSNLLRQVPKYDTAITNAKSLPTSYGNSEQIDENTRALLRELGLHEEDLSPPKEMKKEVDPFSLLGHDIAADQHKNEHKIHSVEPAPIELSSDERELIYKHLTDFSYRGNLYGVEASKINDPIFTTTLGTILFEEADEQANFTFNSNIAFINDHFLKKGFLDYDKNSSASSNAQLTDPHDYLIKLKFLPLLIEGKNQIKYPPIEFHIKLNESNKPDLEQSHMLTVEGENNYYVSLPASKVDLKVSCQITGDLIGGEEDESLSASNEADLTEVQQEELSENDPFSLKSILNSTSSKFKKFNNQPGIKKFFDSAALDFSGYKKTFIPPNLEVNINGETVKYQHISTYHRRTIESEIQGRVVEFNVVEGGSYGGRKIEINIIGDLEGDISEASFNELLGYSTDIIRKL